MAQLQHSADYQTPLHALEKLVTQHAERYDLQTVLSMTKDELQGHLSNGNDVACSFALQQLETARHLKGMDNTA